jgi:hypothetical protein
MNPPSFPSIDVCAAGFPVSSVAVLVAFLLRVAAVRERLAAILATAGVRPSAGGATKVQGIAQCRILQEAP